MIKYLNCRCCQFDYDHILNDNFMKNINKGFYIHIPFCDGKCPYCDFYSVKASDKVKAEYVNAVVRRIKNIALQNKATISTIYFGGGTPTSLKIHQLAEILHAIKTNFAVDNDAEITTESNPCSIDFEYLNALSACGFNRISFGVQSFNNNELKLLGRGHNSEDAINSIFLAQKAGFSNISIDIMMGVPDQTIDSLKSSLQQAICLPIQHISCYMLKLEMGTAFYESRNDLNIADDDTLANMYSFCVDFLYKHGFKQYEISNFSKEGFSCKHNLIYWHCDEYFAIGPSAHSFVDSKRWYFGNDIDTFIKNSKNGLKDEIFESAGGDFDEYFMLNIRLNQGINIKAVENQFEINLDYIMTNADIFVKNGFLKWENGILSMTKKGFLMSNPIITALLEK